ncbi:unnamed protein product [Clonostachys rosea f. rosea IK726]|uniref:Uncharacterized protein n=2 Tax=Bionectria ochroleuca TaxID=29856 RepID=A0A0B7KE11_BIOOC|nr:unnamed protein product [Clonostachys rosea f. rosea IK726]
MESSSIRTDQNRIVEALNAATAEVAQFFSSAKPPTLLHEEESKKQYRSVLENFNAFQQLPGEDNDAELEKVIDIGVQWKDYKQRDKDALAREDAKYLNDLIHRSKQSYERAFAFVDSLIRPITEPEACHQHPTSPQGSAENEQPPMPETQSRSEAHHDSEPLYNEPGPCAPTPGPSQSPVSNKRRFVTALDEPPPPITGPTIDFQEMYQGGNGLIRYTIIDEAHTLSANPTVSGQWWILRCVKCGWHGVNQRTRTLEWGARHAARCFPQSEYTGPASVIDLLGVLVLNCDRGLFLKNNDEVKKALIDGSYEPAYRSRNKRSKLVKLSVPQRESNEPPIITDPKVGILYLAHRRDGPVFGAIVLPLGDFRSRVGIRGSIYDPEPFKALPNCYRFHAGQRKFFWAEGYEDDGGNVTMRQFPVYFLDGPSVEMGHVRWVSADDLEHFDVTKVAAGYEKPVEEYTRFCQCNNGIRPFSCELSKEEWTVLNSDHDQSSGVVNGDQESHRQTEPRSDPIIIEDDEDLNGGPDTARPEEEQIPFGSISGTQVPVHPTNLESTKQVDGEANGSDTSAPNTANRERFPSPQFYIPSGMDMDEEIPQQEQTIPPGQKAPEALMDLGSCASATASPVANRPAAATMQVIKNEHDQGENVNSLSHSFPSAASSRPTVQEHIYDSGFSHYQFAADSPQFSVQGSDISAIHGL